jgi:small GTP-binding protein
MNFLLPSGLKEQRKFLQTLDLKRIEAQVSSEARAQITITGPVNSGKSSLFNQLKGQQLSSVSPIPGTTRENISEEFGPFTLVDTPGIDEVLGDARTQAAMSALDRTDIAILVLDASAGVRQTDANLFRDLKARGLPVVVVLNKIDLIKKEEKEVVRNAELKLGTPIIPISAKVGTNIGEKLIPKLIDAHPAMAVTIGRSLPKYRRKASNRIVQQATVLASIVGIEPIPGLGIPLLIAAHVQMLLRLAAIYGEQFSVARARELLGAIAGGALVRYGAQEAVKFIPVAGWLVSSVAAGTGTWALGQAAIKGA